MSFESDSLIREELELMAGTRIRIKHAATRSHRVARDCCRLFAATERHDDPGSNGGQRCVEIIVLSLALSSLADANGILLVMMMMMSSTRIIFHQVSERSKPAFDNVEWCNSGEKITDSVVETERHS